MCKIKLLYIPQLLRFPLPVFSANRTYFDKYHHFKEAFVIHTTVLLLARSKLWDVGLQVQKRAFYHVDYHNDIIEHQNVHNF